jgi:hypothetical protein
VQIGRKRSEQVVCTPFKKKELVMPGGRIPTPRIYPVERDERGLPTDPARYARKERDPEMLPPSKQPPSGRYRNINTCLKAYETSLRMSGCGKHIVWYGKMRPHKIYRFCHECTAKWFARDRFERWCRRH